MRAIVFLGLALAASASVAATPAAESGLISFELREGDRLIGTPSIAVRLGEPASISVGGPQGYKLELVADRADGAETYFIRSRLYRPAGQGWALVGSPSLTVAPGEQARVILDRSPEPAYTLSVTVR